MYLYRYIYIYMYLYKYIYIYIRFRVRGLGLVGFRELGFKGLRLKVWVLRLQTLLLNLISA